MKWILVALGVVILAISTKVSVIDAPTKPAPVAPFHDDRLTSVADYKSWPQATKKPLRMMPELWLLCVSPTPAQMKALDDFNKKNPHSNGFLRVYMNPLAKAPFLDSKPFPVGSIIVKEKMVGPDTGMVAETVMRKHEPSWNPKTDGWEFYVMNPKRELQTSNPSECISCHQTQAKSDWVYRNLFAPEPGLTEEKPSAKIGS